MQRDLLFSGIWLFCFDSFWTFIIKLKWHLWEEEQADDEVTPMVGRGGCSKLGATQNLFRRSCCCYFKPQVVQPCAWVIFIRWSSYDHHHLHIDHNVFTAISTSREFNPADIFENLKRMMVFTYDFGHPPEFQKQVGWGTRLGTTCTWCFFTSTESLILALVSDDSEWEILKWLDALRGSSPARVLRWCMLAKVNTLCNPMKKIPTKKLVCGVTSVYTRWRTSGPKDRTSGLPGSNKNR